MSRQILSGKLTGETRTETFDFTSRVAISETLSTATVTSTVYSGTDASPSAVISGTATISGKQVTQKVTGGTLGVTYELLCTVTTSLGQTLVLAAFLTIVPNTQ